MLPQRAPPCSCLLGNRKNKGAGTPRAALSAPTALVAWRSVESRPELLAFALRTNHRSKGRARDGAGARVRLLGKFESTGCNRSGTVRDEAVLRGQRGKASGSRISGSVLGGGGDWILVGPDGWGRLDVRAQLALDDGAVVLTSYFGVLELNSKVMEAMGTLEGTDFGDQYFRITPRFETGDERYAWLNQSVFVAEGRMYPGSGVEYRVYRVT